MLHPSESESRKLLRHVLRQFAKMVGLASNLAARAALENGTNQIRMTRSSGESDDEEKANEWSGCVPTLGFLIAPLSTFPLARMQHGGLLRRPGC